MVHSEYEEAVNEIKAEIAWRSKMFNKAENEKKQKYWKGRVDKMRKVLTVLEDMAAELNAES